jgi:predicted dehydrogenase
MLKERALDALYVTLPPFAHDGQIEAAARAGVHLFLEKPIALDVKRAESIVRAVERAGVVSVMGYHMRFGTGVRKLKKMIVDGSAGRPTLFQGSWMCNALGGPWWRDVTKSGGHVVEQIIHIYDMALHLFGDVASVSGTAANLCHTDVKGYTIDDTSASVIKFVNGAVAGIVGSNCAVPTVWKPSFTVVCEKVVARFDGLQHVTFTYSRGKPSEWYSKNNKKPKVETLDDEADAYAEETKHFLACVRGKERSIAPAREGLVGLQLVRAVASDLGSKRRAK